MASQWRLLYKPPAVKSIQKLPAQVQRRLKNKLEWFVALDNPVDFAQSLTKPADAQYRFRVGDYRILFDIEGSNIVILYVAHRKDIYRKRQ